MTYKRLLDSHGILTARRTTSIEAIRRLETATSSEGWLASPELSVFVAGSLGRLEAGSRSDIDFFPVTNKDDLGRSFLRNCQIVAALSRVNAELDGPPFSNDGRFLRVYKLSDMVSRAGYEDDDSSNHFTTRMLMILEGRPVLNHDLLHSIRAAVADHYYKDGRGKKKFRPLFLLNDILRYWRTLCLNYEKVRTEAKPWRKKNINLKFSRMLTVYATVLPILLEQLNRPESLLEMCAFTPLERLVQALEYLGDARLLEEFPRFLDTYARFLEWKDDDSIEPRLEELSPRIREAASFFANYLFRALMHDRIQPDLRRYLVV